jgi:hypothetical protein
MTGALKVSLALAFVSRPASSLGSPASPGGGSPKK